MVRRQIRFMLIEMSPNKKRTRAVTPELELISGSSFGYKSRSKNCRKLIKKQKKKQKICFLDQELYPKPGTEIGTKIEAKTRGATWVQRVGPLWRAHTKHILYQVLGTGFVPTFGTGSVLDFGINFRTKVLGTIPDPKFVEIQKKNSVWLDKIIQSNRKTSSRPEYEPQRGGGAPSTPRVGNMNLSSSRSFIALGMTSIQICYWQVGRISNIIQASDNKCSGTQIMKISLLQRPTPAHTRFRSVIQVHHRGPAF